MNLDQDTIRMLRSRLVAGGLTSTTDDDATVEEYLKLAIDDLDSMAKKKELKPCPFCGGAAMEYVQDSSLCITCMGNGGRAGCKATLARVLLPVSEWELVVQATRDAWNRRQ